MRAPSKVLYTLLTEMLGGFSLKFPTISNNQRINFTVLKGCDDYIERVSNLKMDPEKMLKTALISADFGDAYTETGIKLIQKSVTEIGEIIGADTEKIDLIRRLVELVFSNCYFFTPFGLFRQTRGMPMGDVSSRDSLDIDLTNSEFKILSELSKSILKVHLYCRLVDDVSAIVQGEFSDIVALIQLMASKYPKMPLNVQISYGYSRFLDLHIFNICKPGLKDYKLVHSLAYKDHSSFSYTSMHSNIHEKYKHAIVPISLYRIHTRCTEQADKNHHLQFMSNVLTTRSQDPNIVHMKTKKFFMKKKNPIKKAPRFLKKTTPILFDKGNMRHVLMRRIFKKSFQTRLMIVYKSKPSLGSILCPKRRIIRRLQKYVASL